MLLVSGNGCFHCAADHGLLGSFFKHPANICCQAPLVLLITHGKIMVKWGQLAWPRTVWTKRKWWISTWVLIFTITTCGSTHWSKHSKVPLSHFYGSCPVAPNGYMPHWEELLSPASVTAITFFAFDRHLHTRPAVPYFHYVTCMSPIPRIFKTKLLIPWSSRLCRCFLYCQSEL